MLDEAIQTQNARDRTLEVGGKSNWAVITGTCDIAVDFPGYRNFQVEIPAGAITIGLPRQQEAKGIEYRFCCTVDGGGSAVIQDKDDAFVTGKDYASGTMNDIGETVVVKGNGLWYEEYVNTIS